MASDNLPLNRALYRYSLEKITLLTTRSYFIAMPTANHSLLRAYKQRPKTLRRMRFFLLNYKILVKTEAPLWFTTHTTRYPSNQNPTSKQASVANRSLPSACARRSSTSGSASAATGDTAMRSANSSAPKSPMEEGCWHMVPVGLTSWSKSPRERDYAAHAPTGVSGGTRDTRNMVGAVA